MSASTQMAKKSWPSSVAVVSQTWPSMTTGVDQPRWGIVVFQRTFFDLAPVERQADGRRVAGGGDVAVAGRAAELGPVGARVAETSVSRRDREDASDELDA